MPNHVETICSLTGSSPAVEVFKNAHIKMVEEELVFDFNTVISMPECLARTIDCAGVDRCFFVLGVQKKTALTFTVRERYGEWFAEKGATDRAEMLAWCEANEPEALAEARRQVEAQLMTGYPDWYEWSLATWGTKWNSYWFSIVSDEPFAFTFCTAWSFPHPIFVRLAARHPELTIDCRYVDEMGNFEGQAIYRGGAFDEGASWCREPAEEPDDDDKAC